MSCGAGDFGGYAPLWAGRIVQPTALEIFTGNDGLIGAQRRPSSSMGRTCEEWRCGDAAGQLPAEWFGPAALAAWSC